MPWLNRTTGVLHRRYQCPRCQDPDGFKRNRYRGQGKRPTGRRASCATCGYIARRARA